MAASKGIPRCMDGFGARLREARLNADLTQGELAELIGIAQAHVSRLERAKRVSAALEVGTVVRITEATGVRMGWLVANEDPMYSDSHLAGQQGGVTTVPYREPPKDGGTVPSPRRGPQRGGRRR